MHAVLVFVISTEVSAANAVEKPIQKQAPL
jgi:hypothetical protein